MLLSGQDLRDNGYGGTRRDRRAQSFLAGEIVNDKLDIQSGQRFQARANSSSSPLRPAESDSSGRPPTVSVKPLKPYCDKLISLPVDVVRMIVETSIRVSPEIQRSGASRISIANLDAIKGENHEEEIRKHSTHTHVRSWVGRRCPGNDIPVSKRILIGYVGDHLRISGQ